LLYRVSRFGQHPFPHALAFNAALTDVKSIGNCTYDGTSPSIFVRQHNFTWGWGLRHFAVRILYVFYRPNSILIMYNTRSRILSRKGRDIACEKQNVGWAGGSVGLTMSIKTRRCRANFLTHLPTVGFSMPMHAERDIVMSYSSVCPSHSGIVAKNGCTYRLLV